MPIFAIEPREYTAALGLEAGDRYAGLPVVASPYGSPQLYVLAERDDLSRLTRRRTILPTARPEFLCRALFVGPWPPPVIERPFGILSFENMVLSWGDLLEGIDATVQAVDYGRALEMVICDTGIKPDHEFWEAVNTNLLGELTDTHGHGSFVASQVARLLPAATFRAVRVLDGAGGTGSESGIVNKLGLLADLAVRDPRPRIANNSWGADGISQGILDAYKRCLSAGVVMTCAAGNSGPNVAIGTPAAASPLVAGAYNWRDDRLADFSSGGDRWPQITAYCAGVNEWGIGIGGFNHYHQSSGTSMADPYLTALCGILRCLHPDWTAAQAAQQVMAWAQPLAQPTKNGRGRGYFPLSGLPGSEEPPMDPRIHDELVQAITEAGMVASHLDTGRYELRGTDDPAAWNYVGEASRIQQVQQERLLAVLDLLPKADPPPPVDPPVEPPPTGLGGVAVSYSGHAPARDLYLGYTDEQIKWGRHDSLPIHAPVAGTVTRYAIGTPLSDATALGLEYTANLFALADGWVCSLPVDQLHALGQTMYIAVLVYDTPIQTSYGLVRADWAGHVRSNVKTGRVASGEVYAEVGASGIQFEQAGVPHARAAHIHAAASSTGQLSPNGDVNGMAFAEVRGWKPLTWLGDVGPGPQDYLSGQFCAGRKLADFTAAGKAIPPPAPD